jgi:hypothetical protein
MIVFWGGELEAVFKSFVASVVEPGKVLIVIDTKVRARRPCAPPGTPS